MGRRRNKDKHLPLRVYLENGRYWFKPKRPDNPPPDWKARIDLGTTLADMYTALGKINRLPERVDTMDDLFDRFLKESLPALAPRTQSDYRKYIERMRPAFKGWRPAQISAGDVFELRAKLAQTSGAVQANRHISCLSAALRDGIGWRALKANPCRELERLTEHRRDRYVWDHEYLALYDLAPRAMHEHSGQMMQGMMDLATMTGQREGDLLKLPMRDRYVYTDEGIVFRPGKSKRRHPRHGKLIETGKTVIVEWSPELKALIERLRAIAPDIRKTLICNEEGKPYTESGFRSNWHRLMQTALHGQKVKGGRLAIEPVLKEDFTFHDLRAKSGSDADDVQEANDRLAHDDLRTTQVIYRRKPRRARPGRKVGT